MEKPPTSEESNSTESASSDSAVSEARDTPKSSQFSPGKAPSINSNFNSGKAPSINSNFNSHQDGNLNAESMEEFKDYINKANLDDALMQNLMWFSVTLTNKFYYCGFLYKMDAVGYDGESLIAANQFEKWWAELWGTVLHMWRVPDELASFSYAAGIDLDQMIKNEIDPSIELIGAIKSYQKSPTILNLADSTLEVFPEEFVLDLNLKYRIASPPIPYTNYFAISNSGSNLYILTCASTIQCNLWASSIYLALFENQKIHSLFTYRWLAQPQFIDTWSRFNADEFSSGIFRSEIRYEGPLQIRLPFSTLWKQYHVIVTSKFGPDAYLVKANTIFGNRKTKSVDFSKRGSIWFFESEKNVSKGIPPLFSIQDVFLLSLIWPTDVNSDSIKSQTIAKINGSIKLWSLGKVSADKKSEISKFSDEQRNFQSFKSGYPAMNSQADFADLVKGLDNRPIPQDLLIAAPSPLDLATWATAIFLAFGINSDGVEEENHFAHIAKEENPWTSRLFLSVSEIGGITIQSRKETYSLYSHYLGQKILFSQKKQLQIWSEQVTKGEWSRGVADRKEILHKLNTLIDWVDSARNILNDRGFGAKKPSTLVLISAMSSILPRLEPVLSSMVSKSSPAKPNYSPTKNSSPSSKSKSISVSNSEGSVSEEERSDEGSQSDDDSEPEYLEQLIKKNVQQLDNQSVKSDREFQVYAPNSLLAQVAENEREPRNFIRNSMGPFISTGDNNATDIYAQNSLIAISNENRYSKLPEQYNAALPRTSLVNIEDRRNSSFSLLLDSKRHASQAIGNKTGPLLGPIDDSRAKPQPQGGLLGEMDRREKEAEHLKKMGIPRQSGFFDYGNNEFDLNRQDIRGQNTQVGAIIEPFLLKMNGIIEQMGSSLQNTNNPSPMLLMNLQGMVGQLSNLMGDINTAINRRSSFSKVAPNPLNPYSAPNLSWRIPNTNSSDSLSFKRRANQSENSETESSYTTTSTEGNEDIPLVTLKGKAKLKNTGLSSGTESTSEHSVTRSSVGSASEESSENTSETDEESDEKPFRFSSRPMSNERPLSTFYVPNPPIQSPRINKFIPAANNSFNQTTNNMEQSTHINSTKKLTKSKKSQNTTAIDSDAGSLSDESG